jgi:hypothetical protein
MLKFLICSSAIINPTFSFLFSSISIALESILIKMFMSLFHAKNLTRFLNQFFFHQEILFHNYPYIENHY